MLSGAAERSGARQWDPNQLGLTTRNLLHIHLASGDGLDIPFSVLVGRTRTPRVLVISGVHGDEYEGPALLHDLAVDLAPHNLQGTVTLVPVANPAAFHAGTRRHPQDLADLNRIFPGDRNGAEAQRLAALLFGELVEGSDAILSIHGWSKEGDVIPYAEYQEADSEVGRRSYETACALGLGLVHPYAWPGGELGGAALRAGIPTVEVEVGGMGAITSAGQAVGRRLTERFLAHWGVLDKAQHPGSEGSGEQKIVRHEIAVASCAGLFRARVRLGQQVEEGELLGRIDSLAGACLEQVFAPRAGIVAVLRTLASVQPGDLLSQIFYPVGRAE